MGFQLFSFIPFDVHLTFGKRKESKCILQFNNELKIRQISFVILLHEEVQRNNGRKLARKWRLTRLTFQVQSLGYMIQTHKVAVAGRRATVTEYFSLRKELDSFMFQRAFWESKSHERNEFFFRFSRKKRSECELQNEPWQIHSLYIFSEGRST